MNIHVLLAVFRQNFVSYFANPTGYVFICLFVLLGAIAAFWVPEFFANNLANLDQLGYWLPFIMLIYIPTITMGIWADERKQGTDELLLTIPAADFDIVLGKYLAAAAIFSVSLLFSLVCNYLVLNNLASTSPTIAIVPRLDLGLFLGNYVGYWLVGLAMLGIGLVASFLTSNATIGFVLGVLFNTPLVFLSRADAVFGTFGQDAVQAVKRWSVGQQLYDFSRGVLSLSSFAYFFTIVAVALYASMILIGRRHWFVGGRRWLRTGHFLVRLAALVVAAGGIVAVFRYHDARLDVTSERLNSLSQKTRDLVAKIDPKFPVVLEAFISPTVPEAYVQTQLNLRAILDELKSLGNVQVKIYDADRFGSDAAMSGATLAETRYGIKPRQVASMNNGQYASDNIYLYVAGRCGVRPIPVTFIDRDTPVEYELARSICTASEQKRLKLGILTTDAPLYGTFNIQTMTPPQNWPIVEELEKQYDVVRVDPSKPITEKLAVLLAVQPSAMGETEMSNFIEAIKSGIPTAIFEDPFPALAFASVPATSAPRQPPGGGMNPFMQMPPPPKADSTRLWDLLGVDFATDQPRFPGVQVVWQAYNPYPKIADFDKVQEYVFIDASCGAKEPFAANDPISSGLQQLMFPFPGYIAKRNVSELKFTPLVTTSDKTGTVLYRSLAQQQGPYGVAEEPVLVSTGLSYVLAAHIQGKVRTAPSMDDPFDPNKNKRADAKKPAESNINVVLTADIDMLTQAFFILREQGDQLGAHFQFDNVTFVLNALDELAGEQRFLDIRKRRRAHRVLARVEDRTKDVKKQAAESRKSLSKKFEEMEQKEQKTIDDKIAELQGRKNVNEQQMAIEVGMMMQDLSRQKQATLAKLREEKDREVNKIEMDQSMKVRQVQFEYKLWAVLLPPIPPLLVAFFVFIHRRVREREGVARSRLR
jgi:ABC-2 type transport system permease protein